MKEKVTSLQVAVKEMDYFTAKDKLMVDQEISMMKNVYETVRKSTSSSQFLHVVQLLGFFKDEENGKGYIVLEYCSKGDLRKYIEDMKRTRTEITPKLAYEMISQIASSLNQLHASGIIHADLKPENVLLVEGFKVKLADFGLARQLQVGREYTTNHGGTLLYQGPEILSNRIFTEGGKAKTKMNVKVKAKVQVQNSPQKIAQTTCADIWAFGVMIFELLAQHHPFFDSTSEGNILTEEFINRVVNLPPLELPEHYPLKLKNLIIQMLNKDPSKRVQASDILKIPEVAATFVNN
ncbi:MAG: putative Serine/threonine protein kinase [Streblomastix strix]|uniref:Putative Serine/threonine protein kinase n=1 Tax=Streblomastix strix TaxID=222440 RepID=A0A5J4VV94_9EUKA|nr:MAG: putative Serine/threonine protein kinase [Streblomastix strix]